MAQDNAHEGIRKLLNLLDENELKQLALTTTQNCLKPELLNTKEDAIEIIIRYSADYSTILSRKCIKREILFQYCHNNNIYLAPPVTKVVLIQKVLSHWSATSNNSQQQISETNCLESEVVTVSKDNVELMAKKFTEWFYSLMNANECIDEEHFWQDCSLQINLTSNENVSENYVNQDRTQVVKDLYNTKCQYNLYFNPNLSSDGVFGKMDSHGLVLIFTCGTLHTQENCVGVFEQVFSLARDPFCDNNWKIKNTKLNLKSKSVTESPKLCDTELKSDLLLAINE